MSLALRRQLKVNAQIERNVLISPGVYGPPANPISLVVTHLDPLSAELAERYGIEAPVQHMVCYAYGTTEVLHGDTLVVEGVKYPVRGLGKFADRIGPKATYEIVLERMHNA